MQQQAEREEIEREKRAEIERKGLREKESEGERERERHYCMGCRLLPGPPPRAFPAPPPPTGSFL